MFFILQQNNLFTEEATNLAEQVKKECNGRYSSDNPLKVTILGYKWDSWCFDSAFLTRKLAIHLAKFPEVKVQFLVPEKSCSERHKKDAASRYGVTIVEAREQPGFDEPTDWLYCPPQDFTTDIVVGAGERLGKIAQVFKKHHLCKNIHVVSDPYEEILRLCSDSLQIIERLQTQFCTLECDNNVGLSQMADLVVAPGPKMHEELSRSLSYHKKNVLKLTPGVLDEFSDVEQATAERANFRILMFGGGYPDNFEQEGLKTAAKAVAELNDKSYHLLYVGAAKGKHKKFVKEFCQCGVSKSQLTIRSLPKSEEVLKSLFCESDLAIMPSSELGFGMMGLAALSSGLPVLVHEDSGFGKALQEVLYGTPSTVYSEDANVWAKAIKRVRNTGRKTRLEAAAILRSCYDEKYSWEKQCGDLVQKMLTMVTGMNFFDAFYHF